MTEWQPIETAPKDSEVWILVYDSFHDEVFEACWNGYDWSLFNEALCTHVTHWMPLPKPPEKRCINENWVVHHKKDGVFARQCCSGFGSSKVNYCPICGESK